MKETRTCSAGFNHNQNSLHKQKLVSQDRRLDGAEVRQVGVDLFEVFYSVDLRRETCSCGGWAIRGHCRHLDKVGKEKALVPEILVAKKRSNLVGGETTYD